MIALQDFHYRCFKYVAGILRQCRQCIKHLLIEGHVARLPGYVAGLEAQSATSGKASNILLLFDVHGVDCSLIQCSLFTKLKMQAYAHPEPSLLSSQAAS